ncbi:hypothetical protein J3R83DRAFT_5893 [Lanmaoa asiatica]|nr:hypothetical protein J3R83DRAFT_5893 [Lanmaoa asiatica]
MRLHAMYQNRIGKNHDDLSDLATCITSAALVFLIFLIICTYISALHVTVVN